MSRALMVQVGFWENDKTEQTKPMSASASVKESLIQVVKLDLVSSLSSIL